MLTRCKKVKGYVCRNVVLRNLTNLPEAKESFVMFELIAKTFLKHSYPHKNTRTLPTTTKIFYDDIKFCLSVILTKYLNFILAGKIALFLLFLLFQFVFFFCHFVCCTNRKKERKWKIGKKKVKKTMDTGEKVWHLCLILSSVDNLAPELASSFLPLPPPPPTSSFFILFYYANHSSSPLISSSFLLVSFFLLFLLPFFVAGIRFTANQKSINS